MHAVAAASIGELVDAERGLVSTRVFSDPGLYRLELERVFGRAWLYVAHESEIPRPGDFVTRSMGEDPVVVCRGHDNRVRVFLNICRHRGRKLCAADSGNASHFRCGYHGWTYSSAGELTGVPFFEAYQGKLDKSSLGLYPAARTDTYRGLIFATWDGGEEPLGEYLGAMKWVLDLLFGRTEAVEVVGPPIRWVVNANWKVPVGNFIGDGEHLITTHGFSAALGLKAKRTHRANYSVAVEHGHGAVLMAAPPDEAADSYLALPEALWPELEHRLTPEQLEVMRSLQVIAGSVFPNLSFLETATHTPGEWGGPEGQAISFLTLRQWQPRGVDQLEALSWLFVDRNAPEWWKTASRHCYQRVFGVAGLFEQDDLANWAAIAEALRSPTARRLSLHYQMGLDVAPSQEWPGPGAGYLQRSFIEVNERAFYGHWQRLMTQA